MNEQGNRERERELLAICKSKQGEYHLASHPKTSWATMYGSDFVTAAAELYDLYSKGGSVIPRHAMSRAFIAAGIKSCRGSEMNVQRVDYLIKTYIWPLRKKKG